MPDGAVWVAGSNFNAGPGIGNRELRIEIFEPWYFCGRRPSITDAAPAARHGEDIEIRTPDAADVKRVVIVRCGSVTHNFNSDQRHVKLEFKKSGGDVIVARVPDQPNVAIVGYYLLFVIDSTGRPSTGRFLQIQPRGSGNTQPPWQDEAWWDWLRNVLRDGRPFRPETMRSLRRAIDPPTPPRRRAMSMVPHGPGDQGGHIPGRGPGHGPGGPGDQPGHGAPGHDLDHDSGGGREVARPAARAAAYDLRGDFLEVCDCFTICPCWTGRTPDEDVCTGVFAWVIEAGSIGGIDVGGLIAVSVSTHAGHREKAQQRVVLFVSEAADDAQATALAGAFAGLYGGPLGELGRLLGELVLVERAQVEVEFGGRHARLSVGLHVTADTETLIGPQGEPMSLAGARLSEVLGTPAEVGVSHRLKVGLPALGIDLDLKDRSAMRGAFAYRHAPGRP